MIGFFGILGIVLLPYLWVMQRIYAHVCNPYQSVCDLNLQNAPSFRCIRERDPVDLVGGFPYESANLGLRMP